MITTGASPNQTVNTGPYFFANLEKTTCGGARSQINWWRFPKMGNVGGEIGNFVQHCFFFRVKKCTTNPIVNTNVHTTKYIFFKSKKIRTKIKISSLFSTQEIFSISILDTKVCKFEKISHNFQFESYSRLNIRL